MRKISGLLAVFFPMLFLPLVCLGAQTALDFTVPGFPGSTQADARDFQLGGRQVQVTLYRSNQDSFAIAGYYRDFFSQNGFAKNLDTSEEKAKLKYRHLRFKKDDLAVTIFIMQKPENAEISILKYLQPPGTPPLEETLPSVSDPMFALPKEDRPGKDLPLVPRPPESVRIANLNIWNKECVIYTTALSLEEVKDFYKKNMAAKGWEALNEAATEDAVKAYEKTTGKQLSIESPFVDGESFSQVIKDSFVLNFTGKNGRAKLTIFSNFMASSDGSMVRVDYQKE